MTGNSVNPFAFAQAVAWFVTIGGIYNAGTATVQDSTVSGNDAGEGGGIYNDFSSMLTLCGSTVTGNTGDDVCNLGNLKLKDSTIGYLQ